MAFLHYPAIAFAIGTVSVGKFLNYGNTQSVLNPDDHGNIAMIMVILDSIHFELFVELRHTKAPYIYFYCITLWKTSV